MKLRTIVLTAVGIIAVFIIAAVIGVVGAKKGLPSSNNNPAPATSATCNIVTNQDGSWQANVGVSGPADYTGIHFDLSFFDSSGTQIGAAQSSLYNVYVAAGQTLWANDAAGDANSSIYEVNPNLDTTPSSCQVLGIS